jgi:signal transduction histidine kinase
MMDEQTASKEIDRLKTEIDRLHKEMLKLEDAKKEADRAKTEYTQNVAHQLAAPINAIKMNIEAVKNPRVSFDRRVVLLSSIYAQGSILAHLVKNFSLMSHLEADHQLTGFREEPENVDLYRQCVNLSNDFQPVGKYKEQSIYVEELEYEKAKYPKVHVVKNLFSQVIYNLLDNATKYANAGTKIVIGLRASANMIGPTIKSLGIPISKEAVQNIFERGVRGDGARKLHPAGTGFGLYIARRIMEIHGGTLNVEANGKETTFIVQCPRK